MGCCGWESGFFVMCMSAMGSWTDDMHKEKGYLLLKSMSFCLWNLPVKRFFPNLPFHG